MHKGFIVFSFLAFIGYVLCRLIGMTLNNIPIHIDYKGKMLRGVADPIDERSEDGFPRSFVIYIHGKFLGILSCTPKGWTLDRPAEPELIENIGTYLHAWFE